MFKKTYQIKHKSAIGQQVIKAFDVKKNMFVKETAYAEPNFKATREEAKTLLNKLKERMRRGKVSLFVVEGG